MKGADRSLILPETFRVCGSEEAENLTGYDFGYMTNYGNVCFAAEVDGKIVAAACTNYPVLLADDQDDRRVEIGVETSPEYRRRGYGISCAAALVNELVAQGFEVLYECGSDNPGVGCARRPSRRERLRKEFLRRREKRDRRMNLRKGIIRHGI